MYLLWGRICDEFKHLSGKAAKVVPELEVVNPIEFFENFGKTTEEIKKGTNEQGGSKETKTKSAKKDGKVEIFSPRSSPRKLKHSRPEGTLPGRNIELSQSPSKAQSKTVLLPRKTSRKAECVEVKRTETTAEPKNRKIEKKEEVTVKARKDKADEQEKSPIGGAEGRKSRKMKSLESKSLDDGKIREIANTAQKVRFSIFKFFSHLSIIPRVMVFFLIDFFCHLFLGII